MPRDLSIRRSDSVESTKNGLTSSRVMVPPLASRWRRSAAMMRSRRTISASMDTP